MSCPRSSRCVAQEYRGGGDHGCQKLCHARVSAGGIPIARPIPVQHLDTCEPVRTASVHGPSQPFVVGRPDSGLEPIQRRGHHPMVRVLLELLQQLARLVGFRVARPVAHQAAQDFGAAHPHRAVGVLDCQGG